MFASPISTSNTGYPTLAATSPPAYGPLNPGPTSGQVQANSTGIASGPLFGERVTADADASLFQPNISPDVVTVAVTVPKFYFKDGVKELHVPQGTLMYLIKDTSSQSNGHMSRAAQETGCIHKVGLGVFPGVNHSFAEEQVAEFRNPWAFPTVAVGPATLRRNKLNYVAVAIQNVSHVSTANVDKSLLQVSRTGLPIGSRLYFVWDGKFPMVKRALQTLPTRELTLTLPIDPAHLGSISCDIGRVLV